MDYIFFNHLLQYVNHEGESGALAREGIMTLFETIFTNREVATPQIEQPETEVFMLEDEEDEARAAAAATAAVAPDVPIRTESSDQAIEQARSTLARHFLEQEFVDVLVSGIGAVYSDLPTKLRLSPPEPDDDMDYEGGVHLPESDTAALFDMSRDPVASPDVRTKLAQQKELAHLACISDSSVQSQLAILEQVIDFVNYLIQCCQDPPSSVPTQIKEMGLLLARSMQSSIQRSFVDQVIRPFISSSSVHDGTTIAIACYMARLCKETSIARGTVMYLVVEKLLEIGVDEDDQQSESLLPDQEEMGRRRREGQEPFVNLAGLGFLQVIVSKTRARLAVED